jgi:hypothetical protein
MNNITEILEDSDLGARIHKRQNELAFVGQAFGGVNTTPPHRSRFSRSSDFVWSLTNQLRKKALDL